MSENTDLAIVLPAYRPLIDRLSEYIEALDTQLAPGRIHVPFDGIKDTDPGIRRLEQAGATVSPSCDRQGKGAALSGAFDRLATSYDRLLFLDADESTSVESAANLAEQVGGSTPTLAIGYREPSQHAEGQNRTGHRRVFSSGYRQLAHAVLGIDARDPQCGAKAMDASVWWQLRPTLRNTGFGWDTELLAIAAAAGIPVSEHPVEWVHQPGTTVRLTDPVRMLGQLFTARRRASKTPPRKPLPSSQTPRLRVAGRD
ncbi:glycosyltransferase family protein [Salinigranum halophilum]|uniref:dolichol-P-glucose transferase n=1 Tax=Salinigranum halophilum TaxID=2565931 RepID=UPI0010A7F9E7|nr:dolichol-P-glucose transferase [Salinigranum halophilum]